MRGTRTAHVRAQVNALRVRELQLVLADMNLARSGRKQELIDRIVTALEQLETKATDNATNHATSAFYNDQLSVGLRSLQTHATAAARSTSTSTPMATSAASASAASASSSASASASTAYAPRTPPPVVYGRPIPFNAGHHQRAQATHHHLVPPPPPSLGGNNAHATEVLHATMPATLDGARCFCNAVTAAAVNGKVVTCVACALRVHAKCHQLVNAAVSDRNDWYCESCRAALCDPFLRVKKTVLAPVFVKFNRAHATQRIEYTITDQDINDIYGNHKSPGSMKPGSLELQLRCFILKEELGTGTSWPTTSVIAANGFGLQLVQRAPPGQSNPSKVLREQPADLFPYSRVGRNVLEVRTGEHPVVFCFMVQIVEFRDLTEIVNEVRAASESITYDDAKKNVIKSFGGGDDDEEDDDDAVVATSTVLSLRCPLGLCLIDLPARGVHCKHLQCFDLKTFLTFNKKARSRHYRCTVCHNFIKASDLRIDPYLKKLLREVQGDDELEEVEILPDASWKRRLGDDAETTPPPKRVKLETSEAIPAAATAAATATPTVAVTGTNDAGSAAAPFEIDLSLSSDEDDDDDEDDGLSAIPTLTATTGTPSSVSATTSTANLSDDDVAIFTVDSDVWDLPPTGGGSAAAAGHANGDVPFPLDIFASFGANNHGGSNHVDLSMTNGTWATPATGGTAYTLPALNATTTNLATGIANGYAAAAAPAWVGAGVSTTTTASAASARGAETGLATAMAQLSRNHPHVTNPFDARRSTTATAYKPSAAAASGSTGGGGGGGGGGGRDDVICLLDSDSE